MRAYSIATRLIPAPPLPRPIARRTLASGGHPVNQHVANRLKKLRLVRGDSQTELGAMMGLTFQQIAKYERGTSKIGPDRLWCFARYFDVEIAHFFEGYDPAAEPAPVRALPPLHAGERRVRLQLAAAIQEIRSRKVLRSLLSMARSLAPRG